MRPVPIRPAAVALLLASACLGCSEPPAQRTLARGLVLISLDAVRPDHLPTYGYPRATAPALDRLARSATVFERAFAQDTNTLPSHASLFTGVYPHMHGSRETGMLLHEGEVTLAEVLRRAGFRTGGFVSGGALAARASGLERGFEVYDDAFEGARRPGRVAAERALEWLGGLEPGARFFLFLHLFDAHGPYRPEPPYDALFATPGPPRPLSIVPHYQVFRDAAGAPQDDLNGYVDRYDATIRAADDAVAALLAGLDLAGTAVIVLADHGETLGERPWPLDHGGQVYDEQARVPLIAYAPGAAPRRVETLVELIDVLPTALELVGVPRPKDRPVVGESLVPLIDGKPLDLVELAFTSARPVDERHAFRGYRLNRDRRILSVRGPRWKAILYPGAQTDYSELYDLLIDPGEAVNLAAQRPDQLQRMFDLLESWAALGVRGRGIPGADGELEQAFRALGYVGAERDE